jgi:extradiol dioxygenase family protein
MNDNSLRPFHPAIPVNDLAPADGDHVPSRHFGVVLDMDDWQTLATTLEEAGCDFLISPRIRVVGEQATLFIYDPSGNALEFKSFADPMQLFATHG